MKKIVLIYGLISGAIMAAMFVITTVLYRNGALPMDKGEILGYTTMVISLSMIFFGIKSYRDNQLGGSIHFGKAFGVGVLIALTASLLYAILWEFYFNLFIPDFMDQYAAMCVERAKIKGADAEGMKKVMDQVAQMKEVYKNPFLRFGMTLMEMFPVGALIALICAAVLRKKSAVSA